MGIIKAFSGAIKGTFADQWKDIISVEAFDEHKYNAGTWPERFGFTIVHTAIESIQFTKESHNIITHYTSKRMDLKA